MPDKLIELRTETGQPVESGNIIITPQSQSLVIHVPRLPLGLVWNRPLAVKVNQVGLPEQTIPVLDITRLAQLGLLGLGMIGAIIIRRIFHD